MILIAMIALAYVRGGTTIAGLGGDAARGDVTIDADGLYLVPLARYPQTELRDLGISVVREAGAVDNRSPLALGPSTYDQGRGQFVAEEMLERLTETYSIADGRRVLVVGVTSFDMYSRDDPGTGRASAVRSSDGRYLVVSTDSLGDVRELRDAELREILLVEIQRADLGPQR